MLVRSIELLLANAREDLSRYEVTSKHETLQQFEVLLQLLQMLAVMVRSKACESVVMKICEFLWEAHTKISALNFIHIDVITRLNEFLLTLRPCQTIARLIDTTAEIHRKQFERASASPNGHSPYFQGTPTVIDPESYYSKNSAWTNRNKPGKSYQVELDYIQPFSNVTYVYSEEVLSKYYVDDQQPSLKRKAVEAPHQKYEAITKKVK